MIRSICDVTGAHVTIASPGVNERDVAHRLTSVMGSVMAVCWAVDLLAHKAGLYDGHSNIHRIFKGTKRIARINMKKREEKKGKN